MEKAMMDRPFARPRSLGLAWMVAAAAAACSDSSGPIDAGSIDLGSAPDLGPPDGGATDVGEGEDLGAADLGALDGGAALAFTAVTPSFGRSTGGGAIVVEGVGFGTDIEVRVGGLPLETPSPVSGAEAVKGTLPALPVGPASIELRSGGDTVTIPDAFQVGAWAPAVGLVAGPAIDLEVDPNGDGLWLTSDHGLWLRPPEATVWLDRSGTLADFRVGDLAFAPSQPSRRYLTSALDVLRSDDGRSWTRVSQTPENAGLRRLLITPTSDSIQFAVEPSVQGLGSNELPIAYTDTGWRFRRRCMATGVDVRPIPPVSDAFLAPADERLVIWIGPRLYRARDAFCFAFEPMDAGLVGGTSGVTRAPNAERLFALIPAGVYTSERAGSVWEPRGRPDPGLGGVVAATEAVLYGWVDGAGSFSVSTDGGRTWRQPPGGPQGLEAIFVPDAAAPDVVYGRVGDDLLRSADRGETWRPLDPAPPLLSVAALEDDPLETDVVWAATGVGVHRSADGGASWASWARIGAVSELLVPAAGRIYVGREDGQIELSTDGGRSFSPQGSIPGLTQLLEGPGGVHALGDRHLHREEASGWVRTATVPVGLRAVAVAFGPSEGIVNLATDSGGILRSDNGGATWISAGEPTEGLRMTALVAAPGDPNALYASGLDAATFAPRFLASFDGGRTWRILSSVAPTPASRIAISPVDTNRVVFGAGFGVYSSTDGGATSEQLNPGTNETPRAVVVRNGTVRAMLIRRNGRLLVGSEGFGVVYR